MKRAALIALALASAALGAAHPAYAKEEEWNTRIVKDKPDVTFDPMKGYILVETLSPVAVTFFQTPTEEEREQDTKARDEAFAKEHQDWVKKHAQWERSVAAYKPAPNAIKPRSEPEEPTLKSMDWPSLEMSRMISLGPINRFAKSDDVSLYLQEVPPGEYVYYGSLTLGVGACACMGTVKFDVAPGKITTLRYKPGNLDAQGVLLEDPQPVAEDVDQDDLLVRTTMIIGQVDENAHDSRLPADMLVPAEFVPVPNLPNWMKAEINRVEPIPGVMTYDRDRMIDLRAKAGGPSAPLQ